MTTNEHTEQSELAKWLDRARGILAASRSSGGVHVNALFALIEQAAALLAADKAGGEEDDAVAYLRAETTLPKYRGWAVCEDDDPNGFPVYRHPHPQPSALPDDVVKAAENERARTEDLRCAVYDLSREANELRVALKVCVGALEYLKENANSEHYDEWCGQHASEALEKVAAIDTAMLKEGK